MKNIKKVILGLLIGSCILSAAELGGGNEIFASFGMGMSAGNFPETKPAEFGFNLNLGGMNYLGISSSQKTGPIDIELTGTAYKLKANLSQQATDIYYMLKFTGRDIFGSADVNNYFKIGFSNVFFKTKITNDGGLYQDLESVGFTNPEFTMDLENKNCLFFGFGSDFDLSENLKLTTDLKYTIIDSKAKSILSVTGGSMEDTQDYKGNPIDILIGLKYSFGANAPKQVEQTAVQPAAEVAAPAEQAIFAEQTTTNQVVQ